MTDAEYIQWLKQTLPKFEGDVWNGLEKRLREVKYLLEEGDKLTNRVKALEDKVRKLEKSR